MLELLLAYRFDLYAALAVIAVIALGPIYAANLSCAIYIKTMVASFLDHQDRNNPDAVGDRKKRASTMKRQIRKQAKLARKANRK